MQLDEVLEGLVAAVGALPVSERAEVVERLRARLQELSPYRSQPVDAVRWVPLAEVQANDYNPNSVAGREMQLLRTSILHDGYTQPVVTIWDSSLQKYVIVDGFHRYFSMKSDAEIQKRTDSRLPVVVLDKGPNDRMASTVRHNRARGKHTVDGMSNLVFRMLDGGWSDADICNELGMAPAELLRLKHVTGFSKLFSDTEYQRAWVTRKQIRFAREQGATLR
jgi:hypothetical protein